MTADDASQSARSEPAGQQPCRADFPIYAPDGLDGAIRQCEIVTDLVSYRFDPEKKEALPIAHPFTLVLSQDCDLDWDYRFRRNVPGVDDGKEIRSVLLYEAFPADELKIQRRLNSTLWQRIQGNKDERFHFLETVPRELERVGKGLPELVIDFKQYFSIPTAELYQQIEQGQSQRRCRLVGPYKEHLQHRAAFYLGRVGLPLDHQSEPKSLDR